MTLQKLFSVLLLLFMLGSTPLLAQSMSDSQVLEYVKDGLRQGKEQKQMASELARKGVTKEQATRVKQLYEQQNNVDTSKSTSAEGIINIQKIGTVNLSEMIVSAANDYFTIKNTYA